MKNRPFETTAPQDSQIEPLLTASYFQDAWAIAPVNPDLDALGQFLRVAEKTPRWIDALMHLRNRIVGLFGLKNLGGLSQIQPNAHSSDYAVGDRVGIFTLMAQSDDEVLLGDDDHHLKVVVSVHKGLDAANRQPIITVTTVVHVKNWLGRLYMLPVAPAHRLIVQTMMKAIGNAS